MVATAWPNSHLEGDKGQSAVTMDESAAAVWVSVLHWSHNSPLLLRVTNSTATGKDELTAIMMLGQVIIGVAMIALFHGKNTSDAEGVSADELEDKDVAAVPTDTGYVTPTKEGPTHTPTTPESVTHDGPPNNSGTQGAHSKRAPKPSRKQIERLAERFVSHISE